MTTLTVGEDNIMLEPLTADSVRLMFERNLNRSKPITKFEKFVDYVIERGMAEIERQWRTAEKSATRNDAVKKLFDRVRYLNLKKAQGEKLTEEETNFLNMFGSLAR
jgi:hypothetical protein